MQVTRHPSNRRPASTRPRVRRPLTPRGASASAQTARAPVASTVAAKRAGAPHDFAFYLCACGCAFEAAVSTTVGCPGCGAAQAW